MPTSDVGGLTVTRPPVDTSAKVALLLRIVSVGLTRYGLKLMMLFWLAGTVMMLGTAEAELDVAGAEVILIELVAALGKLVVAPLKDELDGALTVKTSGIV